MMSTCNALLAALLIGLTCSASELAAQERPGSAPGSQPASRQTNWGQLRLTERGLRLEVTQSPEAGAIRIPRLQNPVTAVYAEHDKDRSMLKLTPHVTEWEIGLPTGAPTSGRLVVIVETAGPPRLAGEPHVTQPSVSGVITLAAHDAKTHGQRLRYEPQPHKNTLGYWTDAEDWCQWRFVAPPGRYQIQILQGCGKDQGGSEVVLYVGEQEIAFSVEETGHFQNFKNRTLGAIELRAKGSALNEHTLELRPKLKKAAAVMDVRQVRLVPQNSH